MKTPSMKKANRFFGKLIQLVYLLFIMNIALSVEPVYTAFNIDEVSDSIQLMFQVRNRSIISSDLEAIESMYATDTKYGTWAYEYEIRKVKYIHNWEQKQGVSFIEIIPRIVARNIKNSGDRLSANVLCTTEYKYIYEDKPDEINSCRIGTYHILELIKRDEVWVIAKEWYKDPFGDSLNLDNLKVDSIKQYILSQSSRDLSDIGERRVNALEYANRYCGAASEEQYGSKYNTAYRNYNGQGGDCANFASQVLYEGGKFRKNHTWSYDGGGATHAWLNANGFKNYMLNSGRASLIASGSYEKVYKASYKLLPGDIVAYEKKGKVTHISVVTGADSRGYCLVDCHNTDRNRVPWDLGWSNSSIKFWLIRVHY